jgi:hypothetical protein
LGEYVRNLGNDSEGIQRRLIELKAEVTARCLSIDKDAVNYGLHPPEDVTGWSLLDRLNVADSYIDAQIGCYVRLHSRLSNQECDLVLRVVPALPSGQPTQPQNIGSVEDAGVVELEGDERGVFLGVTQSVQGPKGIIPSLVWIVAAKQRDDFRRAVFADLPTINVIIESGQIVAERKVCPFRVDAPASDRSSVTRLIQHGPQIAGDIEKDAGENVGRLLREFDLVNMLPSLRVRLDKMGVRVAVGEPINSHVKIVNVILCANERQTRTVENVSHDKKIRSDERPLISARTRQPIKDTPKTAFGNEAR